MIVGQNRLADHLGDRLAAELERVAEVARAGSPDVRDELVRDERLVEAPPRSGAARASAVRGGFRSRIRSGEPGIIRNRTKLSRTIATIVRIAWTIFRTR